MQHTQIRKIHICPHTLNSPYRCNYHYNTYSFSKGLIHRNSIIGHPETMLSIPFSLRYDSCLTCCASCEPGTGWEPCLSLRPSALPALRDSRAAGCEHYLQRPCCCLIINLAETVSSLAIFSMLDVCWEIFFFLALLLFWIFGTTSAKIFQANSETRHGKLEWLVHVKSF